MAMIFLTSFVTPDALEELAQEPGAHMDPKEQVLETIETIYEQITF